jgi:hypothetical protein
MSLAPILEALQAKKYQIEEVAGTTITIIRKKQREQYFIQGYSPLVPYNLGLILSNKQIVKKILEDAKIPVVGGISCSPHQPKRVVEDITSARLSYPLILRQENSQLDVPAEGPLTDEDQLLKSYQKLSQFNQQIMVEPYVVGEEVRVFFHRDGLINCLQPPRRATVSSVISLSDRSTQWTDVTATTEKQLRPIAKKLLSLFQPLPYVSFSAICTDHGPVVLEVYHAVTPHYGFVARKRKEQHRVLDLMVQEVEHLFTHAAN